MKEMSRLAWKMMTNSRRIVRHTICQNIDLK